MQTIEQIQKALEIAMPAIAIRFQNELTLRVPVDKGRLKNSIKVFPDKYGVQIIMVEYGKFVEFGTLPHVIKPKDKQALKFEMGKKARLEGKKKGKTIVFAKEVKHPGTRPNPFIRETIQTKLKKIILEEINRVIQQV
jgi:hypothetical protein